MEKREAGGNVRVNVLFLWLEYVLMNVMAVLLTGP